MFHPTIRRCIFWSHLAVGITAGLIILVLATTGLLMSFETQIIDQVERAIVREKANGHTTPLSAAEMVAAFQKAGIKGTPNFLCFYSAKDAPVAFLVNRGHQHLFHPTTGEYLGKGAKKTRNFFKTVLSIHRWLTLPAEQPQGPTARRKEYSPWKDIGGHITGAGTLGFLFLLVSGLVIWIPKKRTWLAFKAVLTIQRRLKGRARDWNWHNVAGIWSAPFILTICLTGIIMAYPWANRLLLQSFGEKPPERRERAEAPHGQTERPTPVISHLDSAINFAKRKVPAWESIVIDLPTSDRQPLVVSVTDAGRGRPDRREKFTLAPATLDVVKHETFADMKPGQRARFIVRWLHTGEFGGWIGQLLAALTAVAVIALVWTGFALSYRRFFRNRKTINA